MPGSGMKDAIFSVGMPTGANPAPASATQTKATWQGEMAGSWDHSRRDATPEEITAGVGLLTSTVGDANTMDIDPAA